MKYYKWFVNEKGDTFYSKKRWKMDGSWMPYIEYLEICVSGYHVITKDNLSCFLRCGPVLAEVEVRGGGIHDDDKSCYHEARVVRVIHVFTKKELVNVSACASAHATYVASYAADAAATYAARAAAYAADAADAADVAAAYAADAAARAATYAARAAAFAETAARAATYAADAAADAADAADAAEIAARAATYAARAAAYVASYAADAANAADAAAIKRISAYILKIANGKK